MNTKQKKKIGILIFVILLELIVIVTLISRFYYVFAYNDLEVLSYQPVKLRFTPMNYSFNKEQVKQIIANLFNVEHSYNETNDLPETDSANSIIGRKEVNIRPDLPLIEFTVSYAHELVHIKYEYYDETITAYQTFVDLYESGNDELKNISLVYAQSIMDGCYKGTEYDCGYYILQYLTDVAAPELVDVSY